MESECHLYFSFHHNVIVFADKGVLKSHLLSLSKALGQTKAGLRLLHFWARGIDGMSPTWGYGKCRQGTNIRAVFSGGPSLSGGLGFWDRFLCLSRLLAYTTRSQSGMLKVTPTSFRREKISPHTHTHTHAQFIRKSLKHFHKLNTHGPRPRIIRRPHQMGPFPQG